MRGGERTERERERGRGRRRKREGRERGGGGEEDAPDSHSLLYVSGCQVLV